MFKQVRRAFVASSLMPTSKSIGHYSQQKLFMSFVQRSYASSIRKQQYVQPQQQQQMGDEPKQPPQQIYKTRIRDSLTIQSPSKKESEISLAKIEEEKKDFFTKWFGKTYPNVIECLEKEFKISKPSHIQQLAIPELLKGYDLLSAAQTGTGKTLSYVIPLLVRMKQDEMTNQIETRKNRPRFIIIVPSRELAGQVTSIVKAFSHYLKFRCVCLRSDLSTARMRKSLDSSVDVVVSTPGVFEKMHEKKHLFFTDVRYVVVDEADTLLSKDFKQQLTEKILLPCKAREEHAENQRVQFCFVLATYNNEVQTYLSEHFPLAKSVFAPKLHHNLKNIVQKFITIPEHDKLKHLLPLIGHESNNNRTIIFCNTVNSCRAVHYALTEAGIPASCYHSEIPPDQQAEEFNNFVNGDSYIMVSTDIASRGLDIPHIRHVIMFDFPLNTIDYLHRVGRTGRMGAPGKVTSLANRPREIALAQAIEKAISTGASLEGISSSPKQMLTKEQKKKSLENTSKGKRALYWDRMKMKQDLRATKSKSTGRKLMTTISSKRREKIVDNITIRNPSTRSSQ